jgi:hypothetical protein
VLILKDLGVNIIVKPGVLQAQVPAGLSVIQGLKQKSGSKAAAVKMQLCPAREYSKTAVSSRKKRALMHEASRRAYFRCAPSRVTAMRQFAEERLCQAWRVPF